MSAWVCGWRNSISLVDRWSIGTTSGSTRLVASMVTSPHTISLPSTWSVCGENFSLAAPIAAMWDDDGKMWASVGWRDDRKHNSCTRLLKPHQRRRGPLGGELFTGFVVQFFHSFGRWLFLCCWFWHLMDGCPWDSFDTYSRVKFYWPRNFHVGGILHVYRNKFRVLLMLYDVSLVQT